MSLQFNLLLKTLKDIFYKNWCKLRGKLQFPVEIIPNVNNVSIMDIDSLLTAQEVYLLRRSDNTIENTFCDTTGFLRSEILKPKKYLFFH